MNNRLELLGQKLDKNYNQVYLRYNGLLVERQKIINRKENPAELNKLIETYKKVLGNINKLDEYLPSHTPEINSESPKASEDETSSGEMEK